MLQFMAILGVSTFLSIMAYKIQFDGMHEKQSLVAHPDHKMRTSIDANEVHYMRIN